MDADDVRRKGLDKMNEVYGWQMADQPGEYFALTVDHLFADIWSRPGVVNAGQATDHPVGGDRLRVCRA